MKKIKLLRLRSLLGLCSGRIQTLSLELGSASRIQFLSRKTLVRLSFAKLNTNTQTKHGSNLGYYTSLSCASCFLNRRSLVLKSADGSILIHILQNISITLKILSQRLLNNLAFTSIDLGKNLQETKLSPPPNVVSFLSRGEVSQSGGPE